MLWGLKWLISTQRDCPPLGWEPITCSPWWGMQVGTLQLLCIFPHLCLMPSVHYRFACPRQSPEGGNQNLRWGPGYCWCSAVYGYYIPDIWLLYVSCKLFRAETVCYSVCTAPCTMAPHAWLVSSHYCDNWFKISESSTDPPAEIQGLQYSSHPRVESVSWVKLLYSAYFDLNNWKRESLIISSVLLVINKDVLKEI